MSVDVITELHAKPGRSDALIALLGQSIPDSRAHDGCEDITIRQDQPMSIRYFDQVEFN